MSGFLGGGIGPVALKRRRAAADWWQVAGQTCVAAYQPIGAASLAASYVNLANPGTYDAAPGVAPTLAAGGWQFNGFTQYLTTGIVPAAGWSAIVRISGGAAVSCIAFGMSEGVGKAFYIAPYTSVGVNYYNGNGALKTPDATEGIFALAPGAGYRNGSQDVTFSGWTGSVTREIVIGAVRSASIADFFPGTIAAIAIYSTALSAADVAALTTRMQALA